MESVDPTRGHPVTHHALTQQRIRDLETQLRDTTARLRNLEHDRNAWRALAIHHHETAREPAATNTTDTRYVHLPCPHCGWHP